MVTILDIDLSNRLDGIKLDMMGINKDINYSGHILINMEDLTISYDGGVDWKPLKATKDYINYNALLQTLYDYD